MVSSIEWESTRRLLVAVLVVHQRKDSASCSCGWSELGKSFADHVAECFGAALGVEGQ